MPKTLLDETFATGDESVLSQAMDLYGYALTRYCHNILCDYHEARDVVQMTFIKAFNKRHQFKIKFIRLFSAWSLSYCLYNLHGSITKEEITVFYISTSN